MENLWQWPFEFSSSNEDVVVVSLCSNSVDEIRSHRQVEVPSFVEETSFVDISLGEIVGKGKVVTKAGHLDPRGMGEHVKVVLTSDSLDPGYDSGIQEEVDVVVGKGVGKMEVFHKVQHGMEGTGGMGETGRFGHWAP